MKKNVEEMSIIEKIEYYRNYSENLENIVIMEQLETIQKSFNILYDLGYDIYFPNNLIEKGCQLDVDIKRHCEENNGRPVIDIF